MEVYPRATEKSYREQTKRTYIFIVSPDASKQSAKTAIEEQFNVTVTSIRVLTRKGKKTRFSKGKHAYPGTTYRRDKKLAYVTLKEGDKIKVFEEPEDTKKEDKKADKKAEKEALKDAKKSAKAAKLAEKKGEDK
ncbi:50S ribosomal protein L23 [Candidatus Saccharibacteria bacterium]|nr:50S ribosomal protein L23 [Candidatus Saccharibacteria bacterium]